MYGGGGPGTAGGSPCGQDKEENSADTIRVLEQFQQLYRERLKKCATLNSPDNSKTGTDTTAASYGGLTGQDIGYGTKNMQSQDLESAFLSLEAADLRIGLKGKDQMYDSKLAASAWPRGNRWFAWVENSPSPLLCG
ncbi:hypothetical protein AAG570_001509 [Ranatra chinensis]|uniref:Uncharacterized protein n=1 Tax=Ranatra chinensis TaxID=642074 RepID=A0ABD0Y8Q5_9HEMI